MSVIFGSARIDENGHARGGRAGDQTGKEVSIQKYYVHTKGWRVFRARNPEQAELIAQDMQYACNNKNIGYDQNQRDSLYTVSKPLAFNCSKVTTKCETDCSALVRVCCAYAGINLPNFRTSNEASVLLKSGAFVELKGEKYTKSQKYLRRGDILVTRTQGHTVVVLSNGANAADNDAPIEFNNILVTGKNVYVRTGAGVSFSPLGVVHAKDVLPYLGECVDGWYEVKYKSHVGWISSKYSILTN